MGFSVEVAENLGAARAAVLARIPDGSSVMTNTSVTLAETGIADAINDGGGRWESARNAMFALDFATQAQQMKAIGGQPDYALGSVHAITASGTLVIASASGSQLVSYAWGAANVIFVAGAQKLVPDLAAAHQRIYTHSLPLEDVRAQAAYAQPSREDPGDPPGTARPHPHRSHPPAGRLLKPPANRTRPQPQEAAHDPQRDTGRPPAGPGAAG
jgi:acyl-CoA hydrolase